MPAFAVSAPVGAFLSARSVCFGTAAHAEDYFRVEFGAVPDFPGFSAFRELVLLWFLLIVPHMGVLRLPVGAGLLTGFYLFRDAVIVCSAYLA